MIVDMNRERSSGSTTNCGDRNRHRSGNDIICERDWRLKLLQSIRWRSEVIEKGGIMKHWRYITYRSYELEVEITLYGHIHSHAEVQIGMRVTSFSLELSIFVYPLLSLGYCKCSAVFNLPHFPSSSTIFSNAMLYILHNRNILFSCT
jgi:hypothetical protein